MFLSSKLFRASLNVAATFRPHIHQYPCAICDSAILATEKAEGVGISLEKKLNSSSSNTNLPFLIRDKENGPWVTIEERRRKALQKWMKELSDWNIGKKEIMVDEYMKNCWEAFCNPNHELTDLEIEGTVEFLDQFCEVNSNVTKIVESTPPLSTNLKSQHKEKIIESQNKENNLKENAFLEYIKNHLKLPSDIEKQLLFQNALLDFRDIANSLQLPFFLSCGTALGAHREGYFIPHDNDIDIGVFYNELQKTAHKLNIDVQSLIIELLSRIAVNGIFVIIDICGEIEKGLELRFLHSKTQVPVDLNIYYSPLSEDISLVKSTGTFIWSATYYENAETRRHGMYRYRNSPFQSSLIRLPFCDFNKNNTETVGFLVPPQSYLEECFGADWRTPRKYSYAEGLKNGEYKNIIIE